MLQISTTVCIAKNVPRKRNIFRKSQAVRIVLKISNNHIIGVHMKKYQLEITVIEHENGQFISLADLSKVVKLLSGDPSLIRSILPDVPPPPPPK